MVDLKRTTHTNTQTRTYYTHITHSHTDTHTHTHTHITHTSITHSETHTIILATHNYNTTAGPTHINYCSFCPLTGDVVDSVRDHVRGGGGGGGGGLR